MIWRHGLEDWKAVEDVREVAQQLFRPPPLHPASPPTPPREPAVDVEEAAAFKDIKPEPSGIGGWLGLVALGQVVGILRLIATFGQYMQSISDDVWNRFPTAIWGEVVMNLFLIGLCIYTAKLMFSHSRRFPSFFIAEILCALALPFVDLLFVASIISLSLNKPLSEFLTLEPREVGQMVAGAIGALIWIPYILRSKRVANTFTK